MSEQPKDIHGNEVEREVIYWATHDRADGRTAGIVRFNEHAGDWYGVFDGTVIHPEQLHRWQFQKAVLPSWEEL